MFRTISTIISWAPVLYFIVQSLEQFMETNKGAEKKELALKILDRLFEQVGFVPSKNLWSVFSGVIDAAVAVLNFLGIAGFSTGDPEQETKEAIIPKYADDVVKLATAKEIRTLEQDLEEDEILKGLESIGRAR